MCIPYDRVISTTIIKKLDLLEFLGLTGEGAQTNNLDF
jgi:hypothetical protein